MTQSNQLLTEKKKCSSLKLLFMFCSGTLLKTVDHEATFQIAEELCQRVREEPGYIENPAEKHVVEHKKITANHKTQAPQVNDFCVSPPMGRWKNWAHWNYSFAMLLINNYLGSLFCFLHPKCWIPLRHRSWEWCVVVWCFGWWLDGSQHLSTGMAGNFLCPHGSFCILTQDTVYIFLLLTQHLQKTMLANAGCNTLWYFICASIGSFPMLVPMQPTIWVSSPVKDYDPSLIEHDTKDGKRANDKNICLENLPGGMCQNINRPRTLGDLFIFCNLSLINFTTFYNRNNIAILILSCSEGFSLQTKQPSSSQSE